MTETERRRLKSWLCVLFSNAGVHPERGVIDRFIADNPQCLELVSVLDPNRGDLVDHIHRVWLKEMRNV